MSKYNLIMQLGDDREQALEIIKNLAIPAYQDDIIDSSQTYEILQALKQVIPRTGDISENQHEEGCLMEEAYEYHLEINEYELE